jgi:membrane associated rhomboid family serine protease
LNYDDSQYSKRVIVLPESTPVVKSLIIINAVFYLLLIFSKETAYFLISQLSLIPYSVTHEFQLWRLVTYMFLHGGMMHILFNMLFLWWFGSELEKHWGQAPFLIYYFVTGIGGGLFHLLQPNSEIPVIGASGAIMGILLAYGLKWPNRTVLLWFIIPIKMKYLVIISVVIEFIGAINTSGGSGIAHLAHLGGMIVGFLYLNLNRFRWWLKDVRYRKKQSKRKTRFEVLDGEKDILDKYFEEDDNSHTLH